jgi:uncharacterized repeat protein (TIGR01451 family)
MNSAPPRHATRLALPLLLAAAFAIPSARAQQLQKTAVPVDGNGNGVFDVDETVQYTLVFKNTTTADLTDVSVRDESSACLQFDIASLVIDPPDGSTNNSSGNAIDVALATLAPDQSITLTFNATSTAAGDCCNQATWSSASGGSGVSDLVPGDATPDQPTCHRVSALGELDYDAILDKQVLSSGCLAPGSVVEFRISIRNSGRRPLRNAVFSDVLVSGFSDPVVDAGLTYDPATNRIYVDPRTYGVGEETEYTYRATLPCTASGSLTNTGRFTFEDNDGTVYTRSDSETVTWDQPDFTASTVRWSEDATDDDGIVNVGENVTFAITVANGGGCDASNVTVTNQLDPRFLSTNPPLVIGDGGVYDPATGKIEWNATTTPALAGMLTGTTVTLGFTTQVDPATPPGVYIPNTVVITPAGSETACPDLPGVVQTVVLQNGDVAYGQVVPDTILLRNDGIACLEGAINLLPRILNVRPEPQQCSTPPAIDDTHVQTDTIIDPVSPYLFPGDAAWVMPNCPDLGGSSGRVLIFYELQDDCTDTLRVRRSQVDPADVVVTW